VRSWVCDGARARNGKWEGLNPSPPVTVSPSGSAGAHSVSVMEAWGKPPGVAPMAQMSKPVPVAVVSEDRFHWAEAGGSVNRYGPRPGPHR
jgi:hypothetical protein